ncbi:MAG: hypothetical protein RMK15_08260 [Chloroflexota bacterium]|jgi:hypothetical protein|nr:hypothetical protein [Dehalococcoidia bacterium]MDW8047255.1 hypothetical protein [Chloroflexota bacterium]
MAEHEPERLIAEARRLREQWEAGVYVSLAKAIRVANELADRLERAEQERRAA